MHRCFRNDRRKKWNVSKEEQSALRSLRNNDSVVVLPADKGNATVVMSKSEYTEKALALLRNHPLEVVKSSPKRKVEEEIDKFLRRLFQQRRIKKPLYE